MSDIGDITISKNSQSYPNWHESIFEDKIFWKIIFRNHFFPKISKENLKKISKKIFSKQFSKKFFGKEKSNFYDFWKIFFRK